MLNHSACVELKRDAPLADRCVLVIFGAAGDLTRRLLVPALFNLRREKLLPEEFAVIGVSRENLDEETFRGNLEKSLCDFGMCNAADSDWQWLLSRICYMQGEFNEPLAYQKLAHLLAKTDEVRHTERNYLFYLATPPQVFATIIQHLGTSGLAREEDGSWRRVIIEKPFGVDLRSAQTLNNQILGVLGPVYIHRVQRKVATRLIMAAKQVSVFS